ncbi:MAG: hypothetical protein IKL68_02475 [Clostridia bacterium]|nr:hypothetical protein [Clostridia bacterium]
MYIILTNNGNLENYVGKLGTTAFTIPNSINVSRYNNEGLVTTTNRGIAVIALVDGAKVYETITMQGLFPEYESREELINKVIDEFFEALGIRKNARGYDLLKYMLIKYVKDDSYCMNQVCDVVYPECAKEFAVSPATVAKNAKDLIKYSYERNAMKYEVLFAHTGIAPLTEAPKPSAFLPVIGGKIRALII